jgi:hypothetical protein
MPSPLAMLRRLPGRLGLLALLAGGAVALTGCEPVAIIKSAPVSASFDQKYGNSPLAAGDAQALETSLRQHDQLWNLRLDTKPASAGFVSLTSSQAVLSGRGKATELDVTFTATADSTITGFSVRGSDGEQAYLVQLLQVIAQAGYIGIKSVRVDVYYGSSHHGLLTWTSATGFVYKVLDGRP